MPEINKTLVNDALATDKVYYLWDDAIPGFALRVMPSGVKSYCMKLYINGRQKWHPLGRANVITATEARKKALKAKQDVTVGDDPVTKRKARREAKTVKELIVEFDEKHVAFLSSNSKIAYRHDCSIIEASIGDMLADDVEKRHIDGVWAAQGEMRAKANRIVQVAKTLFEFGIEQCIRTKANPAHKAKKHHDNRRERTLTDDEMLKLSESIRQHQAISPFVRKAIRFMLLTGLRIGEVRNLKWRMFNQEQGTVSFKHNEHKTGRKSGTKTIPLNIHAIELIESLPRIKDNPFVFPGSRSKDGSLGVWLARAWRKIRDGAGLNDGLEDGEELIVAHSLRHTFATQILAAGEDLHVAQKLLGHTSPSSTNRYSHLVVEKARESSNRGVANIAEKMR